VVSKFRLTPDSAVAGLFAMLTYRGDFCALKSVCALPSGVIRGFEAISKKDDGSGVRHFKNQAKGGFSNEERNV